MQNRPIPYRGIAWGCCVAVAIGSLMPWATRVTAFGLVEAPGTVGGGIITLVLAAVAAVALLLRWDAVAGGVGLVVAAAGGLAIRGVYEIRDEIGAADPAALVDVGAGLWLVVLGGAALLICSAVLTLQRDR